jgi:hypothetical protein
MKFYLAPAKGDLPQELTNTEVLFNAAMKERGLKGDPKNHIHEVPTDKDGLRTYVNDLFRTIQENEYVSDFTPQAELPTPTQSTPKPAPAAPTAPIVPEDEDGMPIYNALVLEAQVEALGRVGVDGLKDLDHIIGMGGIGVTFARGVILLCVLASGEHQLAQLFYSKKLKPKRSFGNVDEA